MNDSERDPMSPPMAKGEVQRRDVALIEERVAEVERAQQQESVEFAEGALPPARVHRQPGSRYASRTLRRGL